ncbi:O-antigen ligase family protein [Parablastomonas sp. CN1-191]|uniref:O-antigen ligase family protein n=1 Tax=Parablastomonas sp. CN1-191 TaxID=3400908 RepID=UPI003BF8A3A0
MNAVPPAAAAPGPRDPRQRPGAPGAATRRMVVPIDFVTLAAFAVAPAMALYQGITAGLGVLRPLDPYTATLVPLLVIVGCLVLRLTGVKRILALRGLRRSIWYLLGYLLVVLFSTLVVFADPIERDPSQMFQQYLSTAGAALVFFVMIAAPSFPAAMRAMKIGILVWAFAAILTPLTVLTPLPIGEVQGAYEGSAGVRSFGVLGDGGAFVVSFLAVAFFVSRRFGWLALAMLALVMSGSRIPLIVAGAGIAGAIVLSNPAGAGRRPGARAIRVVLASLIAALLLVSIQVLFSTLSHKFGALNAFDRLNDTDFTQSDRFFSIVQGLEWAKLSPIFGSGYNSYFYFSLRSAAFGANASSALNQIIQTLVDGGVLALLFLGLFFYETLRPGPGRLMMDRRVDPLAMRVWLLTFLVLNQSAVFISPAGYLTILVFALSGMAVYGREVTTAAMPRLPARRPAGPPSGPVRPGTVPHPR